MKRISNKVKAVFFLLVSVALVFIGLNTPTKAADEDGKITITKNATKRMTTSDLEKYPYLTEENLQRGRYAKVNLGVSAKGYTIENEVIAKLDIVLVFDSSKSMGNALTVTDQNGNSVSSTRMKEAKDAATDFANALMDDSGSVQIAIVEFATNVDNVLNFTTEKTVVTNFISKNLSPLSGQYGGTNIHAGIERANKILESGRDDAKKIVIILTDGGPTFYNHVSNSKTYVCGDGQADKATKEDYFKDNRTVCPDDVAPSDNAKAELNNLKSKYKDADVYTISFADTNATTSLAKINPATSEAANPLYKNYEALSGSALKEKFEEIVENAKDIVGTNTKLTDVIPAEFQLPLTEVTRLEELGVEVNINGDGTTTLIYEIGNVMADRNYGLEFIVEAKPAYYGTIYTNESAKLETTIETTNPYYCTNASDANPCDTSLELTVANPKVEIPSISTDDNYGNVGYAEEQIKVTTSILENDSIDDDITENYNVTNNKIVIVEDENVTRIGTSNNYTIKDKGTLTVNQDGTFEFVSLEGVSGDISFNYYVATYTEAYEKKETTVTYSNTAVVTFTVQERELIKIEGIKTWKDNNDQDGVRPKSITIHLYKNGEYVTSKVVTKNDNWEYAFNDLYKYEVGAEGKTLIKYTITEDEVKDYTTTIDGYNVTNKHEVEKVTVSGTKTWEDNDNQDGKRPNEITINLLSDGKKYTSKTVTVEDNWTYTFDNLPKYRDGGIEIVYDVEEKAVDGYTSIVSGYDITNKYTPETITIKGTKTWKDKNNQDGKRPMNISINLFANGEATGKVVTIDADDNWKYEFKNLPKYADGKEIKYTITEDEVKDYTTRIEGFNITNSYSPETTEVTVTKTWKDAENQDGMRPTEITVYLLANNKKVKTAKVSADDNWTYTFENLDKYSNGELINYTVTEEAVDGYTTTVVDYNITNTHTPITLSINGEKKWVDNGDEAGFRPNSITINLLADGEVIDTKLLTVDNWTYTFENLPMYKNGQKINYTVKEESVEKYETSYDEENPYIIVNTHNPSKITVSGTKTWKDNNNQDGIRPKSITVNLTGKVGEEVVYQDSKVVSADDNWKYEFTNLPEYKYGKLIVYTIDEENVIGYSKEINGYDLINTHVPETITINGTKTWDDNNNQDGIRPESITVNLLADESIIDTKEVTVNDEGAWTFEFVDLPKYRDGGIEIKYTLTEESVEGYESNITDFEIKNIHTPEIVSYRVSKVWSDYENNDGIRPESITVRLKADGVEIASQVISEENNWSYSFVELPKYRNEGTLIVYEIIEDEVLGYTTTIESSIDVNNPNNTIVIVTNSHEKEQNFITINKIWEDYNNKYGKRPESITIHLYADGELVETITITEDTDWTAILSKDKYKNGVEVYYTIDEEEVAEYLTTIDGYTVTNKYIVPPHTGIEVDDNQTLYGTVVALMFSLLGSLFLFKNKLIKEKVQ